VSERSEVRCLISREALGYVRAFLIALSFLARERTEIVPPVRIQSSSATGIAMKTGSRACMAGQGVYSMKAYRLSPRRQQLSWVS